jgi:ABC-type transport system involved in multi-copper enzyme maturation permease subunit
MSTFPEMGAEQQESGGRLENATPLNTRVGTVILGRMGFLSVLLRLVGMELYKIRRRMMSRVLVSLAILLALFVPLAVGVELIISQNTPASQFAPFCQQMHCPADVPGQARQAAQAALSGPLRLPEALQLATTQNELNLAAVLAIILVGSIAGGEISGGTARMMFTRGPWRGQFLLAKYGAALVCTVFGVLSMALVGVVVGQLLNLLSGVPQSLDFLSAAWVGHALLYLLATMLNWFMYAVIAVFFGVLGRSTVAGVVGALTWFFAEPILSNILTIAGNFSPGGAGVLLHALPGYLLGNNARALQLNQTSYLFGGSAASQTNLQALITLVIYLAFFIGLTWWLNESRDVTN